MQGNPKGRPGGSSLDGPRNLQATLRSTSYNRQLLFGWAVVCSWMAAFSTKSVDDWEDDHLLANRCLVSILQWLYDTEGVNSYRLAKHCVLATQSFFPPLRGKLRLAWESIESWGHEVPGTLRTAIPLQVMLAMAVLARVIALETDEYEWWSISVLLEVGFFALLRPSELLRLKRCSVALPDVLASLSNSFAMVSIFNAKNKRQLGNAQFAIVRSSASSAWLAWLCEGLRDQDHLWPASADRFRNMVKYLGKLLGLEHWRILPSGLRPGGATHFFGLGAEPGRLMFWGRWANLQSLKHYLQECVCKRILLQSHAKDHKRVLHLLKYGENLLQPPQHPWWFFCKRVGLKREDLVQFISQSLPPHLLHGKWQQLYLQGDGVHLGHS